MLAMDATPADAARFEYEAVLIYHCRLYVEMPLQRLPPRPLRKMRFRCKRCGASLTAEAAKAQWVRQADAHGVPKGTRVLPRFEG